MEKSPFVVNLKNPKETPQEIADKLNTLHGAIDVSVIKGTINREEFDGFSGKITKYINGNKERIDNKDLRWHGGGLSFISHDTTLTGLGTVASPLSVVNAGGGTVTSVSVTSANGVTGVVTNPTTTPAIALTLGAITPTSVNRLTITAPATSATLTVADGKTLTANRTLTLTGTDSTTMTFPTTTATIARTDAGQTFTGTQIMTSPRILTGIFDTNGAEILEFSSTSSSSTYIGIANGVGGGPQLYATGPGSPILNLSAGVNAQIQIQSGTFTPVIADTDAATITFNLASSNIHTVTLGANRILVVSNGNAGQQFFIRLKQDGTGTKTVTWFSGISWAGGSPPTLTTTINKADMLMFISTGAGTYDGFVVGQNI